jgi:hypothetical protein
LHARTPTICLRTPARGARKEFIKPGRSLGAHRAFFAAWVLAGWSPTSNACFEGTTVNTFCAASRLPLPPPRCGNAAALPLRGPWKIMLGICGSQLIEPSRALTTRTKTPVLAIIFRMPTPSANLYLNPHISAESGHMKTIKRPYSIITSRRCIFRPQKYFLLSSSPQTFMLASW